MDILQAIIIGIVQGLTEFLPVSSSAHLIFAQHFFNFSSEGLAFDTLVHLATLIAVVAFFYKDIVELIKAGWLSIGDILQKRFREGFRNDPYKRMAWLVILASVPVGFVGVFFKTQVEAIFNAGLYVPAFFLFVTGTILYLSQRMAQGNITFEKIGVKEAIIIGLAQACAILPGLSRSGTTIAAGLVMGLDKELAAKFSFIMSIPAIIGAIIVQIGDIGTELDANFAAMFFGFLAALISGYFAIKWLINLIQTKSLDIFAYYCWAVGILVFVGSLIMTI